MLRIVSAVAAVGLWLTACAGDAPPAIAPSDAPSPAATDSPTALQVDVGGRSIYARCSGQGSPVLLLEGGDGDTSESYAFGEQRLSEVTRTCVYDRANLGRSDPAPGPRGLPELVGDLEAVLTAADPAGPYVLVGTSGGGYITAGYAAQHPDKVAGMVLIDTGQPLSDPPAEIEEFTAWDHPENIEQRDYLKVENDAWNARRRIGNVPVTVVSVKYSPAEIRESPFPVERAAMRRNVQRQRGWLVLSPQAQQRIVRTGHAVEEADPDLVVDVILDVVRKARDG